MMAFIAATAMAFPDHYYRQEELVARFKEAWRNGPVRLDLLERFHRNVMVAGRYLALPIDEYEKLSGFGARNDAWIRVALELGERVVCSVLQKANLDPLKVSQFTLINTTGIAVPSIDARLMNRIPFSRNLKRAPIFGLGCLGGAAGVARVADYLVGHPEEAAILLSVELCSLTIQREDFSLANIVATGLFGDGAAAVLMVGSRHPLAEAGRPFVIDSQSIFFPGTEHIMGWDIKDNGFNILLSTDVSDVAEFHLRPGVETFLARHNLSISEISFWVAHPGGPKVMQAMEKGLGLGKDALCLSREALANVGNISSASVLYILDETISRARPAAGSYGLMTALGPAFSAELVLLQW
jgi:alkylresorcinol/alkylpyrone synthase